MTNKCLSQQNFCFNKHTFVATMFWDKTFVPTNTYLSWQTFVFKVFVTTNIILSQQAYFCRDKRHVLLQQMRATKLLSRQKLYLQQLPPVMLYCITKSVKPPSSRGYTWFHYFHSGALNLISTACASEIALTMGHACTQTHSAMLLLPYIRKRDKIQERTQCVWNLYACKLANCGSCLHA